jgi:hypothetical protein
VARSGLPAFADTTSTPLVYSVRDLGAVGDGVADDTSWFVQALSLAAANAGAVFVGSGTYRVSALTISQTCTVFGCGAGSVIQLVSGSTADLLTVTAPDVTVRQLVLDANGTSGSNVVVAPGATACTIQACDLTGAGGAAVRVGATDAVVERILVRSAGAAGVSTKSADRATVRHNEITGAATDGVVVSGGSGVLVLGNVIDGTGGVAGIRVTSGAVDTGVSGNSIRATGSHGIVVDGTNGSGTSRVAVRGNAVAGSGGHGLYVTGASRVTAVGNAIGTAGGGGIVVDQGVTGLVLGSNVAEECSGSGLRLDGTSQFSVVGNVCWGNGTAPPSPDDAHGIRLGSTAAVANGVLAWNRCGDGASPTQLTGIALRGVVAAVSPRGNSLSGNVGSGISVAAGAAAAGTGVTPTASLTGVTVGSAPTAVPHGLSQAPDSVVISMRSPGQIWITAPSDATNIHLAADAAGRICDVLVG